MRGSFALQHRVLLLQTGGGIGLDISLGALPYERMVVDRASSFEFEPQTALRTCSAEDLLVMKLFAGRPIDMRDAEGIAVRQAAVLEWSYVEAQLQPLAEAKGDDRVLAEYARIRDLGASL